MEGLSWKHNNYTFILEGVWPRLQSAHEKPHWISLDFDHWEYQHEEGSEEEEEEGDGERNGVNPEMMEKMVCGGKEGTGNLR